LFCFQGISPNEILNITAKGVDLRKGTIKIEGTKRTAPRTLKLEPIQIIDLHNYLHKEREELLKQTKQKTEQLIIHLNSNTNLANVRQKITEQLKKNSQNFKNLRQLRRSVIMNWLKEDNLRIVQYKAGHRYISSTEKYKTINLEILKSAIILNHPLG